MNLKKTYPVNQHLGVYFVNFSTTVHERSANADCFLRHMHEFKYISNIDIDEVIVPSKDRDWPGMLLRLEAAVKKAGRENKRNSFQFPHFAFYLDGPKRVDDAAIK